MALLFDGSRCAICRDVITEIRQKGRFFTTSGVFMPDEDPLSRFCDAPMHWSCYEDWPERPRFAKAYVDMWIEFEKKYNPPWGVAYLDEGVFVTVNPHSPIEEVLIRLFETGSGVPIKLQEWESWLADPELLTAGLRPIEVAALREALPSLRTALPTAEAVVGAVDWESKRQKALEKQLAALKAEEERLRAVDRNNEACATIGVRLAREGLTCPHCGKHSKEIRFMNKNPKSKWFFICKLCAHSFGPKDLESSNT